MYGKSNKQDYTKEALQGESRTKLFFDILGVKYGQLIKLNLVLIVCLLPTIIWTWLTFSASVNLEFQERAFYMIVYSAGLIPCLLIVAAPIAGITYLIKNFTQDKHVWLWKDFVSHSKSNAKQAVLYMLIYSIVLFIGQIVLYAYTVIMATSIFIAVLRGIYIVIYVLIALSAIYAFPLMVTYELKLKHVIKNSLLLTIGSLNTTIVAPLLALIPFALFFGLAIIWSYGILVLMLYALLFGLSFGLYIIISFTIAVFDKHLNIEKNEATEQEENSD